MADRITFTHFQAKQLLDMFDESDPDQRVVVVFGTGTDEEGAVRTGLYTYDPEYPEEGSYWLDEQEPLPDLILRLHRDGMAQDDIAAELAHLGRASEADAAGISIQAVIEESATGVGGTDAA